MDKKPIWFESYQEKFLEQICIELGEEEKIPAMMNHFLPKVKALRDVEKEYMKAEKEFYEARDSTVGDEEFSRKKDILGEKKKKLQTIRWNTDRNIESNIKEVETLGFRPGEKTKLTLTDSPTFVPGVSRARVSSARVSRAREGKEYESKYTESKTKSKSKSKTKSKSKSKSKSKKKSKSKSK